MVGKINAAILADRVYRVMIKKRISDQGGRGADKIFTLKQIDDKAYEKKQRVYMGFFYLEKAYDRVNIEILWQVLRNDVGSKLLNGIKSLYVSSLACVRVNGDESEYFRINSGVR